MISESTVVISSIIWGKTEIKFSDIRYIIKINPKSKTLFFINVISANKAIGIFPYIGHYKELLYTILSETRKKSPDASIDVLVAKIVSHI